MKRRRSSPSQRDCPVSPSARLFLLLEEASKKPLIFLQSLDDERLRFLTLPTTLVDPGYCLKINSEDLSLLGFETVDESQCLASWPWPRLACPRPILLAPVLVNRAAGLAVQVVRDDAIYGCCHPLVQEVSACS